MKKGLIIFSLLVSIFSFSSCSSNKTKIYLEQSNKVDSFIKLESQSLVQLINQNKDFVLTIGSYGCESCEVIKPVIINYIQENKTPFYWIENKDYNQAVELLKDDPTYAIRGNIYSASLLLFDNGKDIKYINYDIKMYSSNNAFNNKMKNYLDKSGIYNINDYEQTYYLDNSTIMYEKKGSNQMSSNNLDELIASNEKVTIVYSWEICPDCVLLYNDFLKEYMEINNSKKIYIYDVSAIKESSELDAWTNFVTKYSLPSYKGGKVPSIVTYQNNEVVDSCVFVNDTIEEISDGLYSITSSFWGDRVIGLNHKTYEGCKELSIKKHIELLKEYLITHL